MITWNLYRFDYLRYVEMRPILRAAKEPAAFASLADQPETDAIVEALIEGDIDAVGARQAFLIASCCIGESLPCPSDFPRILRRLRRDIKTEAGIELLSDAIAGARNMDTWLLPKGQLAGFLTPVETEAVLDAYRLAKTRRSPGRPPKRTRARRGGLLPGIATFLRRLFDRGLAADELYRLLGELLEEAVDNDEGIAVVCV